MVITHIVTGSNSRVQVATVIMTESTNILSKEILAMENKKGCFV